MKINIHAELDYWLPCPTPILLQVEAAAIPEQFIDAAHIEISLNDHFARVPGHDHVGERIWLRAEGRFTVDYRSTISINRILTDCFTLPMVPQQLLPGEAVQYLLPSRYCQSDQFQSFVQSKFGKLAGGPAVKAMRDWVEDRFTYVPGVSNSETTAADTFIRRQGICRDYAHVLITLVRAAGIPARIASVYALGVEPQDFHAVAEIFLGGEWHLVDATGMASEKAMAKIGIGRDAADVAFLTAYGTAVMNSQRVSVESAD